ncbi:hypothetical protein [Lentzea albidocapillata]|uniref:hypothetical protein n=1 Tax=Lentzea albidocapillata TaxID=40571 RepID=UPI0011831625|nr:hypothetical protein [Lentzea albidocapillata]
MIAAGAVIVVVGLAIVLLFPRLGTLNQENQASSAPQSSPASSTPTIAPLAEEQAKALAADLTSGDEPRVRRALAISDAQPLDLGAVAQLASIAPLTIDTASFQDANDGTASTSAQTGGASGAAWTLHLVVHDGNWKISSTEATQ